MCISVYSYLLQFDYEVRIEANLRGTRKKYQDNVSCKAMMPQHEDNDAAGRHESLRSAEGVKIGYPGATVLGPWGQIEDGSHPGDPNSTEFDRFYVFLKKE